jgi:hypothetical protein
MIQSKARRWLLPIALLLAVVVAALVVRRLSQERAQRKREATYQSALRSYSKDIRAGMTRKQVEDYLEARNVKFRQMCCVDASHRFSTNVYDDLVRIGQEDAPWFCSEKNVYVAFEFTGPERNSSGRVADSTDMLRTISTYQWLEGCL